MKVGGSSQVHQIDDARLSHLLLQLQNSRYGHHFQDVHDAQTLHKRVQGAGLGQMVSSTLQQLNPVHHYTSMKNRNKNKSQRTYRKDHQEYAQFASEAYKSPEERASFGDWQYHQDLSSETHGVWGKGNKKILALKGTSSMGDLIPDLFIATGTQDYNKMYKDDQALFEKLQKEHPDSEWSVTGHSLGGNRAMYLAQNNGIHSYAFNPGYVGFADDRINTKYAKHHVVVNEGDLISNSALDKEWKDITTTDRESYFNPIANHSMDNIRKLEATE